MSKYTLYCGDVLENLKKITQPVNCVITSPPYYKKRRYGASTQELGQEKSVKEYIKNLCQVFNAIPLHPKGSLWVNIGDKRNKNGGLIQVPEMFTLYMTKKYGWSLVDHVIWAKSYVNNDGTTDGNVMPEPAVGRLNGNGHEVLYRFVKTKKTQEAWTDTCAVRIPRQEAAFEVKNTRYLPPELMSVNSSIEGRNISNVWRCPLGQIKAKHFAVYAESLIERPIVMTCPSQVCSQCGYLRQRIVKMVEYDEGRGSKRVFGKYNNPGSVEATGRMDSGREYVARKPVTTGWTSCEHQDFQPGVVLDPFMGSGTTGIVALKLGRKFIGIDLYQEYVDISSKRCQETLNLLESKGVDPAKLHK